MIYHKIKYTESLLIDCCDCCCGRCGIINSFINSEMLNQGISHSNIKFVLNDDNLNALSIKIEYKVDEPARAGEKEYGTTTVEVNGQKCFSDGFVHA